MKGEFRYIKARKARNVNVGKMKAQEALKILKDRFPDRKFEIVETANKMQMLVRDGTFLAWIVGGEVDLKKREGEKVRKF